MRLFVGVFPPGAAVEDLSMVVDRLAVTRAGVRVVPTERWHITLAFLGEVPDGMVEPVQEALVTATAAPGGPPGELRVRGGGRFGRQSSTVLWAGIDGDLAGLTRLGRAVRRELRAHRLHPDDSSPFLPHLTLARPGDRVPAESIAADLEVLAAYSGPWWPVSELVLVRSYQGPCPSYHPVVTAPLSTPGPTP